MADNFVSGGCVLNGLNKEELDWLEAACEAPDTLAFLGIDPGKNPQWAHLEDEEGHEYERDEPSGEDTSDGNFAILSDDCFNPGLAALVIQQFFIHFDSQDPENDYCVLRWAEHCSKLRVDEFGGGAMIVSRYNMHSFNTEQWIDSMLDSSGKLVK